MKLTTYLVRGLGLLLSVIACIQVSYSQCNTNCTMYCNAQINVSLDYACQAEFTPAMGGTNINPICNYLYSVALFDQYNTPIQGTTIGIAYTGQNLTFKITENQCGNSCWGKAYIEYKYAPSFQCPDSLVVSCGEVNNVDYLDAIGGCANFDVEILHQASYPLPCSSIYSSKIVRTLQAMDHYGNTSTCSHSIYVKRFELSKIIFPDHTTISCTDHRIKYDTNDFPIPWIIEPLIGPATANGVPIICDSTVTNGILCPIDSTFSGVPLIPQGGAIIIKESDNPYYPGYIIEELEAFYNASLCSVLITYTDVEIPYLTCKRKIMRTWEARDWLCGLDNAVTRLQIIEIKDDEAPTFVCPPHTTVTTDYNCGGHIYLNPINPTDHCNSNINVRVNHPNGYLLTDGGYVDLNVGPNTLTYIATDQCNNQHSCNSVITVKDTRSPVAVCELYKVISISQSSQTYVFAEPFDNGSWDECGIDRFEVRRMDSLCVATDTLFGDRISFCCSDVGRDVMVVFRVFDKSQNFNDCMVRVEVQDKLQPTMFCPPNETIDCYEAYDLTNLGLTFGYPTLVDNCSGTIDPVEHVTDNVNQCGVGSIIRTFEVFDKDSIVLAHCKQTISITNTVPFVIGNIIWPLNYSVDSICDFENILPEDLPENYNYPSFPDNDACSLVGYNYRDRVFTSQGGCLHIERYWTIINWCGDGPNGFDEWSSPIPQVISVYNNVSPVIQQADSLFFKSLNVNCQGDSIDVIRSATDDCNVLKWSYRVFDKTNKIIFNGITNRLNVLLPVGQYSIEWKVEDGCGNFDIDHQFISMVNMKPPSAVCVSGLNINLVGMDLNSDGIVDAEMAEVWANDFDSGSSHSCGNAFVFSLSSDITHRSMIFDCSHLGPQEVQMWVTDVVSGAQDFCRTIINVQDNNIYDICKDTVTLTSVGGDIFNEYFEEIEGVEVSLSNLSDTRITDFDGHYAFDDMPLGGSYLVKPLKNNDYLNGVSTLDLVLIQRHILGLEILDSPYKLIASDINNSKDISVLDLIELRKLILGIYNEMPSNTSWRFVDAEYNFIDDNNPWMTEIPETYMIPELKTTMDIDFIGIKIGDVNNTASGNLVNGDISQRNRSTMPLIVNKQSLLKHEETVLEFSTNQFSVFEGMQGTLVFDPREIEILDFRSDALEISEEHTNFRNVDQGIVTFSFDKIKGSQLDKDKLFELKIRALKDVSKAYYLDINSQLTNAEVYLNGQVAILTLQDAPETLSSLISVSPNPWIDYTVLQFELPQAENVEWTFYDVTGRELYKESMHFEKGKNEYKVNRSMLKTQGLIYGKMISKSSRLDLKMIVL